MKTIDLAYRTLYAELVQRSLDASFESDFSMAGNFVRVPVKGRDYWYFEETRPEKTRRYVGPAADPEIARRVAGFRESKDDFRSRRKLVSTLVRDAGLSAPETFTGDVVEALAKAGLFRLRAVLVGTVAFQTYAGHLGVRLPGAALQTGDADFAQFHSVSSEVEDSMPPVIDVLKAVDPTFREISHRTDASRTAQYENASRYRIEFLTPNRGSDDHTDRASTMPSLGGASAQPLRFLDFLMRDPVKTVLLHRSGVPALVPSPERFAVHKLIVATRRERSAAAKREKDLHQAGLLVEALATTRRQDDLALAFAEAWERGDAWRDALRKGLNLLKPDKQEMVQSVLGRALGEIGAQLKAFRRGSPDLRAKTRAYRSNCTRFA